MKKIINLIKVAIVVAIASLPLESKAQTYIKLNAPYALVGIINTQAEFVISPHSSMAADITFSPWRRIKEKHFQFGIMMSEYRYYFKEATRGWYVSANAGMMAFDINRPQFFKGNKLVSLQSDYGKGFGIMTGIGVGWQYHLSERWIMDVFLTFDRTWSWYNRYHIDDTIIMDPQGHEHYLKPDPFNGSAEYMPIKGGISFGYRILNKK